MADGKLYLTRSVEFAAAHRLYREDWEDAENLRVFGACANPHGHGHNYILEVTVAGCRNPDTGMVTHLHNLNSLLKELVEAPLDHRHLNLDVPFLKGILPTLENLVIVLWERLEAEIPKEAWELSKLKLSSSSRNWVEYYGPTSPTAMSPKGPVMSKL